MSLDFRQHIGSSDALRTGSYSKTLTFTLSTTSSVSASRGGAIWRRPGAVFVAAVLALVPRCGGGGGDSSGYTQTSIKTGFVKPADLGGKNMIEFEDDGVAGHIIYTPEDSVPTCPYVQRADDAPATRRPPPSSCRAATRPAAGSSARTARPRDAPPVVTQGAVVFQNDQLADAGMKKVNAAASKCPSSFTILGGPPQIIGAYTINSRPLELHGWKGFAQQLAHTSPRDINPDTYDDLVTVVLHKGNAILYAGFAQIKNTGERADSGEKAEQVMKQSVARLN